MANDDIDDNGYIDDENGGDDYRDQILQLCKLAQGNITTTKCKQQIRKRLKVLDRLIKNVRRKNKSSDTEK